MYVFIPVWLIVTLVALAAIFLAGYLIARVCKTPDGAPACRTASASAMQTDVHKLLRQVPSPQRPRMRAGKAGAEQFPAVNLQQVRTQAISAALRDMGLRVATPNPYPRGSQAHATWAQNYDRLASDQKALQASINKDAAHSSAALPSA